MIPAPFSRRMTLRATTCEHKRPVWVRAAFPNGTFQNSVAVEKKMRIEGQRIYMRDSAQWKKDSGHKPLDTHKLEQNESPKTT